MADMTMKFWEVGDVRAEQIKTATADPALAAMTDGPAKQLLEQLARSAEGYADPPPANASLLLMATVDGVR